jgi:hypothetical protein
MCDYRQFEVDLEDYSRHNFGGLPPPEAGSKIKVGVCAMRKKAKSKPMRAILGRLDASEFEVFYFDEEVIMEAPVESWPLCHALIAFFSDGFPLDKVERYAELRKPFLVNELKHQHLLKDRRHVLKLLEKYGVPVRSYLFVFFVNCSLVDWLSVHVWWFGGWSFRFAFFLLLIARKACWRDAAFTSTVKHYRRKKRAPARLSYRGIALSLPPTLDSIRFARI